MFDGTEKSSKIIDKAVKIKNLFEILLQLKEIHEIIVNETQEASKILIGVQRPFSNFIFSSHRDGAVHQFLKLAVALFSDFLLIDKLCNNEKL